MPYLVLLLLLVVLWKAQQQQQHQQADGWIPCQWTYWLLLLLSEAAAAAGDVAVMVPRQLCYCEHWQQLLPLLVLTILQMTADRQLATPAAAGWLRLLLLKVLLGRNMTYPRPQTLLQSLQGSSTVTQKAVDSNGSR